MTSQAGSAVDRAVNRLPKVVSPTTHAALDYLIVGATVLTGAWLWNRNRRAAVTALATATSELATVLGTSFPGGLFGGMSFIRHGQLSIGQSVALAAAPVLCGFGGRRGAWLLPAHAALMGVLDAITDFKGIYTVPEEDEPVLGIGA